jgi:hypothetical protein
VTLYISVLVPLTRSAYSQQLSKIKMTDNL